LTNFDFLFGVKKFSSFAGACAAAEKIYGIDNAACLVNVRRAAEMAVKWMYENDRALPTPKRDQLAALIGATDFRTLVGNEQIRGLEFIRRAGNNAAHNPESVSREQALLSLGHLYGFVSFVHRRYTGKAVSHPYDKSLLDPEAELVTEAYDSADIRRLIAENRALKRQLNARRTEAEDEADATASPALSEADTRRMYIETDLAYAGWRLGVDLFSEFRVDGMPGQSGVGYVDYLLCDDAGQPLALVETQSVATDIAVGRQQAKLYADSLERRFGVRPVIFLSNGTDTRVFFDTVSAERRVSGFYSKEDLLRVREILQSRRVPDEGDLLACAPDRPYQREALLALSEALCQKRKRSAFLSMAPGSGKTRVAAALTDLLRRSGWVRNVLYLSENDLLSDQAMKSFCTFLPGLCPTRPAEAERASGPCTVFTTFEELLSEADECITADGAHFFTAGRFDLVICDETNREIAQRYRDVLSAFDAPLLALSSAPAEDMDPVLSDILGIVDGKTDFSYTHAQAVREGYLLPFRAMEAQLDLLENGIAAARLPSHERKMYEALFAADLVRAPASIPAGDLFTRYYNADTIRLVLSLLVQHGIRRDDQLAKTIIFTKNHTHSEAIYEEWGKLFPDTPSHACRVIDGEANYVQSLIDDFADPDKPPFVAISHDLLLEGIDIPAVENLVFFTQAPTKAAFWQMLGRAMRPRMPGGIPKESFFVLDLYGNFRRYADGNGEDTESSLHVWSRVFVLQARLAAALQSLEHAESGAALRTILTRHLHRRIRELDRESFSVRRRMAAIEPFLTPRRFDVLSDADVQTLCTTVAPVILPDGTPAETALFDEQMYTLMLARAQNRPLNACTEPLYQTAALLARMGSLPKIARQKKLLNKILYSGFLKNASLHELETARRALQPLIRHTITGRNTSVRTSFSDRILSSRTLFPDGVFPDKAEGREG